jgi:hypothetical protein
MKIFNSLIIITMMFFSSTAFASTSDYNNGRAEVVKIKNTTVDNREAYGLYIDTIEACSRVSGDILHAGDARIVDKPLCHFLLGMSDEIHNTSSPLSSCNREPLPSDIIVPADIGITSECTNQTTDPQGGLCPSRVFADTIGSRSVTFDFPSGYKYNTVATRSSNQEGLSCGVDASTSCVMMAECDSDTREWETLDTKCNCVPDTIDSSSGANMPICSGTPPYNRQYCRCSRWVNWNTFINTQEC